MTSNESMLMSFVTAGVVLEAMHDGQRGVGDVAS